MVRFETRVRALRVVFLAVITGAVIRLVWSGEPLPAVLVAVAGSLKARPWITTWLAARGALSGDWRQVTLGPIAARIPPGWTVELASDGHGLHLDGGSAFVHVILWPQREASDAAVVEALLSGVQSKVKVRAPRPLTGTIGGLPATGQRGHVSTLSDVAVVEVLVARTESGRLLASLSYRDVAVPARLLQRCLDDLSLRAGIES